MRSFRLLAALALLSGPALVEDAVRRGNLKFAHYGAVSYMKEIGPKYGLKVDATKTFLDKPDLARKVFSTGSLVMEEQMRHASDELRGTTAD